MAVVAVLIPMVMLVVLLALGRYEELMLPRAAEEPEAPRAAPVPPSAATPARTRRPVRTAAVRPAATCPARRRSAPVGDRAHQA